MHSLALAMGLTASLYAFLFRPLVSWLPLPLPPFILVPVAMVAAWLVATNLTKRLEPDESPPEWMSRTLIAAAGAYLLMNLLHIWFYFRVLELKDWAMLVTLVLTVRNLKPRAMLFLGVLAFAMELGLTKLLAMLGGFISLPGWVLYCLNLAVAAYVAQWLCFKPDVAADRLKNSPEVLWFFGAAGVATLFIGADDFMFRRWTENLIWLSYLVSFLLLVRHIGEGEQESDGEDADLKLLITMFVALYMAFVGVFHVQEMILTSMPLSALESWRVWLPMLVCVALAVGTLMLFKLPRRLRNDAPGKKALLWGTILTVICVLLGGSIFGASGIDSRQSHVMDFLSTLLIFAVLVGPFAIVAQFLLGVGLLRRVFNLRPPPRD
jgi:hypothetical protein